MTSTVKDTILVEEDAGQVFHRFCTESEGRSALIQAKTRASGGSMFTANGVDAEMVYSVSPDMRMRVDEAKAKLRRDIEIRDALDRNGVPRDIDLRIAISRSITELNSRAIQAIL